MPIERFCVEVNSRINYPIEKALVTIDNNLLMDMENQIYKFCVSGVARKVAFHGLKMSIASWNHHPIPGEKNVMINELSSHYYFIEYDMYAYILMYVSVCMYVRLYAFTYTDLLRSKWSYAPTYRIQKNYW